jgi:hypothetical protein
MREADAGKFDPHSMTSPEHNQIGRTVQIVTTQVANVVKTFGRWPTVIKPVLNMAEP